MRLSLCSNWFSLDFATLGSANTSRILILVVFNLSDWCGNILIWQIWQMFKRFSSRRSSFLWSLIWNTPCLFKRNVRILIKHLWFIWGKRINGKCMLLAMVVKIPIWILRSYDFTISPTQNDLNLSRIFAVVQGR